MIRPDLIAARLLRYSVPTLAVLALTTTPMVFAQTPSTPVTSAPVSAPLTTPDVQILAMVLPIGTYAVSSVYPKQVPEKEAQGRVSNLLKLTGWPASDRHFSDATAPSNLLQDGQKAKLSAASFQTTANIVQTTDGTIDWEPFLRSFGDLHRVNIICFTGPNFVYHGPTHFESDRISLSVTAGKGTVTCVANITKPELTPAPFGLPKYETPEPGASKRDKTTTQNEQTRRIIGFSIIAVLAAGIALFVYGWASRYTAAGHGR